MLHVFYLYIFYLYCCCSRSSSRASTNCERFVCLDTDLHFSSLMRVQFCVLSLYAPQHCNPARFGCEWLNFWTGRGGERVLVCYGSPVSQSRRDRCWLVTSWRHRRPSPSRRWLRPTADLKQRMRTHTHTLISQNLTQTNLRPTRARFHTCRNPTPMWNSATNKGTRCWTLRWKNVFPSPDSTRPPSDVTGCY